MGRACKRHAAVLTAPQVTVAGGPSRKLMEVVAVNVYGT